MRCVWRTERSVKWSSFRGKFYLHVRIDHHQFDGVLACVKEDISLFLTQATLDDLVKWVMC